MKQIRDINRSNRQNEKIMYALWLNGASYRKTVRRMKWNGLWGNWTVTWPRKVKFITANTL